MKKTLLIFILTLLIIPIVLSQSPVSYMIVDDILNPYSKTLSEQQLKLYTCYESDMTETSSPVGYNVVGDSSLNILYEMVNIAGVKYSEECLYECHLPIKMTFHGSSLPIELTSSDLSYVFTIKHPDDEIAVTDYKVLTNHTYTESVPDLGEVLENITCNSSWVQNGSYYYCDWGSFNETEYCRNIFSLNSTNDTCEFNFTATASYHDEDRWEYQWNDFSSVNVNDGDSLVIDFISHRNPKIGLYNAHIIPIVKGLYLSKLSWLDTNWQYRKQVNITEPNVQDRLREPVFVNITTAGHVTNCSKEIRVTFYNSTTGNETEIPSETVGGDNMNWCYIKFPTNVTKGSTYTYYIYYGNPIATQPLYRVPFIANGGFENSTGNNFENWTNIVYLDGLVYRLEWQLAEEYDSMIYPNGTSAVFVRGSGAGDVGSYGAVLSANVSGFYSDSTKICYYLKTHPYWTIAIQKAEIFKDGLLYITDTYYDGRVPTTWTKRCLNIGIYGINFTETSKFSIKLLGGTRRLGFGHGVAYDYVYVSDSNDNPITLDNFRRKSSLSYSTGSEETRYKPVVVDSWITTPSDFYIEEDNVVYIDVNTTDTVSALNITYDNTNAFVKYCDPSGCLNITDMIPYKKTYTDYTGYMQVNFTIHPISEEWNGYISTVEYDNKTYTYDYHVPNITRSYRYPLYSYSFDYPMEMYILENNTQTLTLAPNENYTYAKTNVTVRYSNQNALVYYSDNFGFSQNITNMIPYEKTYQNLWDTLIATFTVYPLNQYYTGYEIQGSYESVTVPETTATFNKSEEYNYTDPNYVKVDYRYSPIEYPFENKTLMLQFHHFTGNWQDTFYLCTDHEIQGRNLVYHEGNIYCYSPLINLTIECRNCNTTSNKQLVQYWSNKTNCDYLLGEDGLFYRLKYWTYPIDMLVLDSDFCSNYTGVASVTGFTYKGSINSYDNRDKYVFFNGTDAKYNDRMVEFADSLGMYVLWEQGTALTSVKDKAGKKGQSQKIYTVTTKIEGNKATFYIGNNHTNVVWMDEIRIPNTLKYEYLKNVGALYTTHSGNNIPLTATYVQSTNEVIIKAVQGKIPVEPATGSNILIIQGQSTSTSIMIGISFLVTTVGFLFTIFKGLTGDLDMRRIIEIIIIIVIGISLITALYSVI